jgi:PEP-CTERM motif-containing protein
MMIHRQLLWAGAFALAPFSAHAGMIAFDFDTQDGLYRIYGDLTVSNTLDSVGGYDVTGISGTVVGAGGGAITGLIANPTRPDYYDNGSWIYDNVVFATPPNVDYWGVLFAAGGYDYNVYSVGSVGWTYYLSTNNPGGNFWGEPIGSATVTSIPEPATWLMIGLGLAGLGLAGLRETRKIRLAAPAWARGAAQKRGEGRLRAALFAPILEPIPGAAASRDGLQLTLRAERARHEAPSGMSERVAQ